MHPTAKGLDQTNTRDWMFVGSFSSTPCRMGAKTSGGITFTLGNSIPRTLPEGISRCAA